MGIRTHNERPAFGETAFMLASTELALETGAVPVTVRNFAKSDNAENS